MKCVIILSLVAAAYAVPLASTTYGGHQRKVEVNPDGSILINVDNGEKVIQIRKDIGLNGQKKVDVSISGTNIPSKRFQIDDEVDPIDINNISADDYTREKRTSVKSTTSTKTKSQVDVLNEILKDFQGPLDEPSFQKMMKKITKAYEKGEISEPIYLIFQSLDKEAFKEFLDERELQTKEEALRKQILETPTPQQVYPQYQPRIHIFPQEIQRYPQVIPGYPRGILEYPQRIQGYPQAIQGYPQRFPEYLQGIQGYQQRFPEYLQGIQGYQQRFPEYLQGIQGYPQRLPEYQQGIQRYPQEIQSYPLGFQGYPQGIQSYPQGVQGYPQYQGIQSAGLTRVGLQGPQVLPYSQTGPGSVYGLLGRTTTTQTPDSISRGILARQLAQQMYGQTTPRDYLANYYSPEQTRFPLSYQQQQQIPTSLVRDQVPVGTYRQNTGIENLYY